MILEQFNKSQCEVVIRNTYDDNAFIFDDCLAENYVEYLNDDKSSWVRRTAEQRFMLLSYKLKDKTLNLNLKRTDWCQTNYVWEKYRKEEGFRDIVKANLHSCNYLPNSFSLHLIISSSEGFMLMCKNNSNKFNDYPFTWVFSLGEQIELTDIYSENMIQAWVLRALSEELGITSNISDVFNLNSLDVLGLEFEGDIGNFALVCNIVIKVTNEHLLKVIHINEEVESLKWISIEEGYKILDNNCLINSSEFHPSTKDRLTLYYNFYK